MKKQNKQNGITLIALVITIIILLILAGISISALTNQGLFTQAQNAKNLTEEKTAEENAILANYLEQIEAITGGTSGGGKTLTDTDDTKPAQAMPANVEVIENDLSEGIVIKDSKNNEWVWVEVPKTEVFSGLTIDTKATLTEQNYTDIKNKLITYATDYREGKAGQGSYWTDEWYDKCGTTYDGTNQYSQVKYITSSDNFTTAKTYYGTIYTDTKGTVAETYSSGTTYYADITAKLTDRSGCGLTYNEYQETYKKMLSSVYTNGGFWISRYEIGDSTATANNYAVRTSGSGTTGVAVSKADQIPYNYVTCSQAQTLASGMSTDTSKTSSLLFGIQWDLVCKYLEVNGNWDTTTNTASYYLKSNSTSWGNYGNAIVTPIKTGAKQLISGTWKASTDDKPASSILLTTGASDYTKKMNIYDFAGNEWEWTLEHATSYAGNPCADRGGYYNHIGSHYPASYRDSSNTTGSYGSFGFRSTLY